jgi:hypothetical protein
MKFILVTLLGVGLLITLPLAFTADCIFSSFKRLPMTETLIDIAGYIYWLVSRNYD